MKRWMCLLLALSMLLLTACSGGQSAKTDAPAAAAPAAVPEEPYEAVEYKLFPTPDGGYVGDVMPFVTDDGKLEIYYLYDTDHNGQGYHPVYKYVTDDLVGYEDMGKNMDFGTMADPDPAIGTGSVMKDRNGLYHLFYTGHNDSGNSGRGKECVMHATSTDRTSWEKIPGDTFFSPDGYSKDDFRDPEVFWVEEDNCYWMLIAARSDEKQGVTLRYTSTDLHKWKLEGEFYTPYSHYMLECPNIFRIGDTYYLVYSWDSQTFYATADSLYGPFSAPDHNTLDGGGFIMYAGKHAKLNGVDYLCAWLGRAGLSDDSAYYQWAGTVLNHQLVGLPGGRLGVCAPETYNNYFTEARPFAAAAKSGTVTVDGNGVCLSAPAGEYALADMGTRPATMMLECDVKFGNDGVVGFAFGGTAAQPAYTGLCLNARENRIHYEGTELEDLTKYGPEAYVYFDFSESDTHHVKLVCENEIVVLYIDNTVALSSRITRSTGGAHIALFAEGCEGSFSNIVSYVPAK